LERADKGVQDDTSNLGGELAVTPAATSAVLLQAVGRHAMSVVTVILFWSAPTIVIPRALRT
jgi:hypothetical protein